MAEKDFNDERSELLEHKVAERVQTRVLKSLGFSEGDNLATAEHRLTSAVYESVSKKLGFQEGENAKQVEYRLVECVQDKVLKNFKRLAAFLAIGLTAAGLVTFSTYTNYVSHTVEDRISGNITRDTQALRRRLEEDLVDVVQKRLKLMLY